MYLERKIEHLNTQLQAKVDYEDTYKTRLQKARDELHEVCAQIINHNVLGCVVCVFVCKYEFIFMGI